MASTENIISQENDTSRCDGIDMSCGYTSSCKPKMLQKCANIKSYLVMLTIVGMVEGFSRNGINNANITSYERRYLLSSKESSLMSVIYEISAGLCVLFVGYIGGPGNQPRIIAISVLVMSFGNFVMSLAHFTSPLYSPGNGGVSPMCSPNDTSTRFEADDDQSYLQNYLYLLLFGQMLIGYCGAVLNTLGYAFINHSSPAQTAALYISIFGGGTALGPALGFLLGGSLLNVYVDYPNTAPGDLTPDDPAWVGAWWIGFVITAVLGLILTAVMLLFPREFPDTAAIRAAEVSQAHDNGCKARVNAPGFGMAAKDLPKNTWYLFTNGCYVCIIVVACLEYFVLSGVRTFLPKIVSNQFGESNSWSSILTGLTVVPSALIGKVVCGIIIKKYNLNVKRILSITIAASVASFALISVFLANCPSSRMAGVSEAYPRSVVSVDVNLTSDCNDGCGCSTNYFDPVCADGVQYFSPCFAGCSHEPQEDGTYHQCSCPGSPEDRSNPNLTEVVTLSGRCDTECNMLYYVFLPFGFLQIFFVFATETTLTVIILRIVPDKLQTYGISVYWVFLRFLGTIPGPLLFGAMIDASCTLWQDDCGEKGSCWVHDSNELSLRIVILLAVVKAMSIFFSILALKIYKAPKVAGGKNNKTQTTEIVTFVLPMEEETKT